MRATEWRGRGGLNMNNGMDEGKESCHKGHKTRTRHVPDKNIISTGKYYWRAQHNSDVATEGRRSSQAGARKKRTQPQPILTVLNSSLHCLRVFCLLVCADIAPSGIECWELVAKGMGLGCVRRVWLSNSRSQKMRGDELRLAKPPYRLASSSVKERGCLQCTTRFIDAACAT